MLLTSAVQGPVWTLVVVADDIVINVGVDYQLLLLARPAGIAMPPTGLCFTDDFLL